MTRLITLLLVLSGPVAFAADPLLLDSCIAWAYEHYEYHQQEALYQESAELADENVSKNWYPKLSLDASATYQNENISIPIQVPIPGFESPAVPLNFNRVLVNFTQQIYDGSVSANQRQLEASKYDLLEKRVALEKINIKSQVIGIYMSVLLARENIYLLKSKQAVISERIDVLSRSSEYGVVSQVDLNTLKAEKLNIEQAIIEADFTLTSLFASISEITNHELDSNRPFYAPKLEVDYSNNVDLRPEVQINALQIENLEIQKKMLEAQRNLRVNAFGSLGAGYPGYDIFKDEMAPMAFVGLSVKWNFINYNQIKNQQQLLSLDQSIKLSEQKRIKSQLVVELQNQTHEMLKLKALKENDKELIALRASISSIKSAQLENGTITATDYLTELNREKEARLNSKIHELKMILAQLNYLTIQGK